MLFESKKLWFSTIQNNGKIILESKLDGKLDFDTLQMINHNQFNSDKITEARFVCKPTTFCLRPHKALIFMTFFVRSEMTITTSVRNVIVGWKVGSLGPTRRYVTLRHAASNNATRRDTTRQIFSAKSVQLMV
jgi:hypothetical protein